MTITNIGDEVKAELYDLLFGGDTPVLLVGRIGAMEASPVGVAIIRPDGGVATKALPARAVVLFEQLGMQF